MKPPTVHRFAGDDLTATRTACGLWIDRVVENRSRPVNGQPVVRYIPTRLVVDADVRRVTCGNCARRTAKPERLPTTAHSFCSICGQPHLDSGICDDCLRSAGGDAFARDADSDADSDAEVRS